jgi:hypothetical protein
MTVILWRRAAVSNPQPRPAVLAAGRPDRAESTAAAVVVLPMPISPVPNRDMPSACAAPANAMPVSMALKHWASVMAGILAMLPVPRAIL